MKPNYPCIAQLRTQSLFEAELKKLGVEIPFDAQVLSGAESPLAQPFILASGKKIGNRFAIHPMEGWDGTREGNPTEYTIRRWKNFGRSGAKLIWGGEATAVRPDGRANPNQLMILDETMAAMESLRKDLVAEHHALYGNTDDLLGRLAAYPFRKVQPAEHQDQARTKNPLSPSIVGEDL